MTLFDSFDEVARVQQVLEAKTGPLVRDSDPVTSRDAAASIAPRLSEQRRRVLSAINLHPAGATAAEITAYLATVGVTVQQSVVARRCTDLRDLDLIAASPVTRLGVAGRALTVWTLTDTGAALLAADRMRVAS